MGVLGEFGDHDRADHVKVLRVNLAETQLALFVGTAGIDAPLIVEKQGVLPSAVDLFDDCAVWNLNSSRFKMVL